MALATETLERRFDAAFGVERSEGDRDVLIAQRLQADLSAAIEALAEPDTLREHVAWLEQQIRKLGGEPWQLPGDPPPLRGLAH